MQFQSLGQEDLLEKKMATHSSILSWKFHGCWQKIQDSWVRGKGHFITHHDGSSQNINFVLVPCTPVPISDVNTQWVVLEKKL